jgi:tetratricopeptide (TPR) repeat protein
MADPGQKREAYLCYKKIAWAGEILSSPASGCNRERAASCIDVGTGSAVILFGSCVTSTRLRFVKLAFHLATVALLLFSAEARADAVADCNDGASPAVKIRGCSAVIARTMLSDALSTAYMNRGIAHAERKETAKALADFSASVNADAKNNFAYYNRGNVYLDLGKLQQAVSDYSKAIEIASDMSPAFLNRGLAYEMLGERSASIADYRAALALEPTLYAASEGLKRLGESQ